MDVKKFFTLVDLFLGAIMLSIVFAKVRTPNSKIFIQTLRVFIIFTRWMYI